MDHAGERTEPGRRAISLSCRTIWSKAELKYQNGVPVLVVSGTPEEIGRAVGALGVKPAARVVGCRAT